VRLAKGWILGAKRGNQALFASCVSNSYLVAAIIYVSQTKQFST